MKVKMTRTAHTSVPPYTFEKDKEYDVPKNLADSWTAGKNPIAKEVK